VRWTRSITTKIVDLIHAHGSEAGNGDDDDKRSGPIYSGNPWKKQYGGGAVDESLQLIVTN